MNKLPALVLQMILVGTAICAPTEDSRKNVLFIISDDLTAMALGCYGNTQCQTPHLDKLASQGTLYTKTYCQFPTCGPSRASIMSGYYPSGSGAMGYSSGRKAIGDRLTWSQYFGEKRLSHRACQ